ncbi:hypothetical protein EDB86DRAFT_2122918 [Lactarius hatsudake]|nr:hypothetical protein EDB86DRAFT_2122918 [Lactarius hatsudake]
MCTFLTYGLRKARIKTHVARDLSSLVNEAYITLQPCHGSITSFSQHNLGVLETDQLDDPHLITEVIEIREALEDSSTESEVDDIKKDVAGKISETMENVEHAVHVEDWAEAHCGAVRLKYLRSIEAAAQSGDDRRTGDNLCPPVVFREGVKEGGE